MTESREWPEIICVLCGLIVVMYEDAQGGGSLTSYPTRCAANAGGSHVEPGSLAAERAKELHAAWLRDPFGAPTR